MEINTATILLGNGSLKCFVISTKIQQSFPWMRAINKEGSQGNKFLGSPGVSATRDTRGRVVASIWFFRSYKREFSQKADSKTGPLKHTREVTTTLKYLHTIYRMWSRIVCNEIQKPVIKS
jgi:hypothetical protein